MATAIRKNKLRPMLRYHGGKWMLAPWIISHFPTDYKIYVEPYGGAASILIRKPRSYAEVYNELDPEIVNVFKVMRDQGPALIRALNFTPFAREEFENAYEKSPYVIEQARRTIIKSFMGFGSDAIKNKSGFRANSHRSGTTPAGDWKNWSELADRLVERLQGVVIENRNALDVIAQHDREDTFFYIDPPYVHSTRQASKRYEHEMTDEDHRELATLLKSLRGKVMVSGYDSALYSELYAGWRTEARPALADGARPRLEILWMNYA